jgi:hypothetical protein
LTTTARLLLAAKQTVQLAERLAAGDFIDVRVDLLSG